MVIRDRIETAGAATRPRSNRSVSSPTNRLWGARFYVATNELDHDLRHRLVSVNAIELMRHWVAVSGRRYDNSPGRAFICELTILRDHDELLHGTPP
jgi:hypothetical protein